MSEEEVAWWEDTLMVNGNEVCYSHPVYNEAIVVPENMDAIRALAARRMGNGLCGSPTKPRACGATF